MSTDKQYLLIKTMTAPKTSLNARGTISYAVLKDTDDTDAYFCLLSNEGGGYFSREAVPFHKIQQCLSSINSDSPVSAKLFRHAFVGRSVNNAGFLVHALRHEQLLLPAPDASHQHLVGTNWDAWRQTILSETGQPFELPDTKKEVTAPTASAENDRVAVKAATDKKGKKAKKQLLAPDKPAARSDQPEEETNALPA
ncbi:MAG: hypothetical protein RLZZ298_1726 [Pseudomonadota bacterium]|jgi:hypothetical protein